MARVFTRHLRGQLRQVHGCSSAQGLQSHHALLRRSLPVAKVGFGVKRVDLATGHAAMVEYSIGQFGS